MFIQRFMIYYLEPDRWDKKYFLLYKELHQVINLTNPVCLNDFTCES